MTIKQTEKIEKAMKLVIVLVGKIEGTKEPFKIEHVREGVL